MTPPRSKTTDQTEPSPSPTAGPSFITDSQGETIPGPGFIQPPTWPGAAAPDELHGGQLGQPSPGVSTPTRIDLPSIRSKGRAYAKIAAAILQGLGGLINKAIRVDKADEAFIPDDDDEQTIPPPAGRLAARHLPLGNSEDLSEIEDLGVLVVGLVSWVIKGVTDHMEARRERGPRGNRQPGVPVMAPAGPDEQPPPSNVVPGPWGTA